MTIAAQLDTDVYVYVCAYVCVCVCMHICPQALRDRVRALKEEAQLSSATVLSAGLSDQVSSPHSPIAGPNDVLMSAFEQCLSERAWKSKQTRKSVFDLTPRLQTRVQQQQRHHRMCTQLQKTRIRRWLQPLQHL